MTPYEGKLRELRMETEQGATNAIRRVTNDTDTENDGMQDAPPAEGNLGWVGRTLQRLSSREEGGDYQGFLSYAAEWHSLVLGFGAGFAATQDVQNALIAYSLGRGGSGQLGGSAHARDVAREPAYAIAGLAVGRTFRGGLNASQYFAP